ncbi:S41 family peptidase [Aquiflexum lacus]|uniref:S41 family peptidase n=1 Tax=Aquiflexum lacus TaxID=2483805 RepID=UPI0018933DBC|nr:S41 family peptidase [Aquiflexum lacus]
MKRSYKNLFPTIFLLTFTLLNFSSCKDKEEVLPPEPDAQVKINTWIKDVMDQAYFWLEDMRTPIAIKSEPEKYFESLLFRPTDRFSVIYPDYQELINSLQGVSKEAGYEIILARESNQNNNVIAFVTYIKKGSPADLSGLKRGDMITRINGARLTLENYQELLSQRSEPHSISPFRFDQATDEFVAIAHIDLTTLELAENPNFLDTVFTINNEKIGYVVYHFFAPGTNNAYDNEMDQIFADFKAEGINHLILDFRYNSGGFVNSAINLASLIAPGVGENDILSRVQYNSFLSGFDDFKNVTRKFKTKSQNLGPILTDNRVYVITSNRTASASELIINGLKPYMDVFMVGDVTVGKNVGSIPLEDEDNPDNKYGILPIVFRDANKNGESDFANGFIPNIGAREITQKWLLPFGDTNEYLLKTTLNRILGNPPIDEDARIQLIDRINVGSSLDSKSRFGLIIDNETDIKSILKLK